MERKLFDFCNGRNILKTYFCLILCVPIAFAQTSPNEAERLRTLQEQERIQRQQLEQRSNVNLAREPMGVSTGTDDKGKRFIELTEKPCFVIRELKLEIHSQETETEAAARTKKRFERFLEAADQIDGRNGEMYHDPLLGQCLGARGLNMVLTRLQNALTEAGYTTTRVLAKPQDLKLGVLQLDMVMGYVGKIIYKPETPAFSTGDLKPMYANALPLNEGDVLNLRDIEMALENFKRVPTADADIQITPSQKNRPGLSDLHIIQKQKTPYRFSLSLNDSGSKGTGQYMGAITLSLDQALWANDLFYITLNADMFNNALNGKDPLPRGTQGYVVHYSLPVGYWLIETTHSQNTYHQTVGGLNQNYIYRGGSMNKEIKLSNMLMRDASRKLTASFKLWQRKSDNFIDDAEVLVQRRIMGGYETGLYYREVLNGKTQSSLEGNISWKHGLSEFEAIPAYEELQNQGTARPRMILADLTYSQPFEISLDKTSQKFRFTSTWRAQWNQSALLTVDYFAIGGRYSVRGYDTSLAGERGYYSRNDLAWTIPTTQLELYMGLDFGEISGRDTDLLATTWLCGSVLGVKGRMSAKGEWTGDVFWGTPVYKPSTLKTSSQVAGFSLSYNF
jgi:hemolysin activation/secretion protein